MGVGEAVGVEMMVGADVGSKTNGVPLGRGAKVSIGVLSTMTDGVPDGESEGDASEIWSDAPAT